LHDFSLAKEIKISKNSAKHYRRLAAPPSVVAAEMALAALEAADASFPQVCLGAMGISKQKRENPNLRSKKRENPNSL